MEERPHLDIAQRIRETLPRGKTGLLFMGAYHDVGSYLGNNFQVSTRQRWSAAPCRR